MKNIYFCRFLTCAAVLILFFVLPSHCHAAESGGLPVIQIYSEDSFPAWEHQDLTFHFLAPVYIEEEGYEDYIDYEIADPSQIIIWRSTDYGDNWYDITGTADARITKDSLIVSNLEESVLNMDEGGQGYWFQIEFPTGENVDRYSNIIKIFLLDEATLHCYTTVGGDRGGGNRHDRPSSVTQPPQDGGEGDKGASGSESTATGNKAVTEDGESAAPNQNSASQDGRPANTHTALSPSDASAVHTAPADPAASTDPPDSTDTSVSEPEGTEQLKPSKVRADADAEKIQSGQNHPDKSTVSGYAIPALTALGAGIGAGVLLQKKKKG